MKLTKLNIGFTNPIKTYLNLLIISYKHHHFKRLLTQFEYDERLMETGKDYPNFPESFNNNNTKTQLMAPLNRSNTMPDLSKLSTNDLRSKSANVVHKNKPHAEKYKIDCENHDRIQRILLENRKHDIDLITPDRDLRLLRIKLDELENARGAKPNLKQTNKQHINTLYNQEGNHSFFTVLF